MSTRSRREYTDLVDAGNFSFDGQQWNASTVENMTSGYTEYALSVTLGSGDAKRSYSEITIWQDGVISFGTATAAQKAFMSTFHGSQGLSAFPGDYISAGYTDESAATPTDGQGDGDYGVEVATGEIDWADPAGGPYSEANATQVLRISWYDYSQGFPDIDKQVVLTATDFTIDNTNYDGAGAGIGIGDVTINGASQTIPTVISFGASYFRVRADINGDSHSDFLIENSAGAVVVGEVKSGAAAFTTVGALGSEWSFHGVGDLLGDGKTGFLIENTSGAVDVAEVSGGHATYTAVSGLGSEWSFRGVGDFERAGDDQFLIENTSGVLAIGQSQSGHAVYTQIGSIGSEWKFEGAGDFLGAGRDQFLIQNTAGAVAFGEWTGSAIHYTLVGGLGAEWKFVGVGDFLGEGHDQFLIENSGGAVEVGDWNGASVQFTQVAALGPEWKFVGAGDFLGEGHAQFLIENSAGAVDVGDWSGGQIHYTPIAGLGSEWSFH